MMSHILLWRKSLVRSRNWRLCWQRPSQNTCFPGEIDLIMKWPSLLHDSSERCVSMISFRCIRFISPGSATPEPFITMSADFTLFCVLTLWAVHVTIIFCSSCSCLWESVTVKTRFYRPKRLSIFVLINIFCGLERSSHPFGADFDTVLNNLLLSDSTLTNISIRNIWVTEAKYSCASIGRRWFAIGDFVAVQAPVEKKNISIFPCWSRDVVS